MNSGKPCDRPHIYSHGSCDDPVDKNWRLSLLVTSWSCFFCFKRVIVFFLAESNILFCPYHTNTKVNRFLNGPKIVIQYTHLLYETYCHQVPCFKRFPPLGFFPLLPTRWGFPWVPRRVHGKVCGNRPWQFLPWAVRRAWKMEWWLQWPSALVRKVGGFGWVGVARIIPWLVSGYSNNWPIITNWGY